jgi:photosystem II stability/assembly factor-like uncharacterized protein
VGDVSEPTGDVTLLYCPDPAEMGRFKVKNSFQGAPEAPTFSIETDMRRVADYLEHLTCPVSIFVHKAQCGRRDDFTNWARSFIFRKSRVTTRGITNLAARNPDAEEETLQTFDISCEEVERVYGSRATRVTLAETQNVTGVAIGGENRCGSDCGSPMDWGDILAFATAAGVGATANVLVTTTGGAPTAAAADPFGVNENIAGIVIVKAGSGAFRIIAARGTTDAGNPAEIAYSDDYGATWANVNVGSTNAEYSAGRHALFALDFRNIWLGTDGGNIYYSDDGGVTWTKQTTVALASDIVAIGFTDENYGFAVTDAGGAYKTVDGGTTWGATSDPTTGSGAANDIAVMSPYFVFVSGTDGLFYTMDGGTTWAQRNATPLAAVEFEDEQYGVAVGSAASGLIYQTIDGGYSWNALTLVANSGLLDVGIVSTRKALVTGAANGGTGFYATVDPVP